MIKDNIESHKILLIKEFHFQLIKFLDELIAQFPKEGDFILIRLFIKDQLPMADVLGRYQRDILPFENQMKNKDDKFFLEHPFLYMNTPLEENKINHFKGLWTKDILSSEDKETIWEWMNVFNKIAKKYIDNFGYISGWEPKKPIPVQTENVTYSVDNNMICKDGVCYLK